MKTYRIIFQNRLSIGVTIYELIHSGFMPETDYVVSKNSLMLMSVYENVLDKIKYLFQDKMEWITIEEEVK